MVFEELPAALYRISSPSAVSKCCTEKPIKNKIERIQELHNNSNRRPDLHELIGLCPVFGAMELLIVAVIFVVVVGGGCGACRQR